MSSTVYKKIFEEKWPSELGGVMLALLNILLFWYSGPLSTTTAVIADWARWFKGTFLNVLSPEQIVPASRYYPHSMLYIGLMAGVFVSALLAKQFSLKREGIGGYTQGFIGGALMGIGSFLAGSCILGGLYSGIMMLSLNGFVMMSGLLAGALIGGKFVMWQINRKAEQCIDPASCHIQTASTKDTGKRGLRHLQPKIAIAGILILVVIVSRDVFKGTNFPTAAFLSGIGAGVIIQRSAFCFAGAFREIFVTKTTRMMRSLIISLVIGVAGFTLIKMAGLKPSEPYVFHTSWRILIGSAIFGVGMTIAGG